MEDSLLALLPVILMVVFLLFYFCKYANTLEKCFNMKFLNCLKRRNENRRNSHFTTTPNNNRFLRSELSSLPNRPQQNLTDQDEVFILLKGQITRMVLAESEAMRLAKTLFENNDFAARECIANLRSNLFHNLSVNSNYEEQEYEINHQVEQTITTESGIIEHNMIINKTLEQPPSYEDCV